VVGNEGEGLRTLVRQSCDFLVRLPMVGKVESLNAAVAGSVVLYQVLQARNRLKPPPLQQVDAESRKIEV
jgi:23S rRNA (guanosine2251-2'-O)-methyltransferase